MKYVYLLVLTAITFSPFTGFSQSVTIKGHTYPKSVTSEGVEWELKGTDHFVYKVFFSVFTGAYYEQKDGEGKRLKFTYTRDLKADDLREQAMKTLEENNPKSVLEQYQDSLTGMQKAYQNVKENDSYVITAIPGKGTWLHLNGKELFFDKDGEFGLWYLDIWLGDPPISDSLKEALTGGK
jgi:hypothetical protein